jgi:septum formation protein
MKQPFKLILASSSPRRKELLSLCMMPFETLTADIDESFDRAGTVEENVQRIALEKAEAARSALLNPPDAATVIIGADTTVVLDGRPLGKPVDFDHAFQMLQSLQGRSHKVLTGFALIQGEISVTECASTLVEFASMSDEEIGEYIEKMKPFDKAGAYGIQDPLLACHVKRIDGCYYNVVGLPLSQLFAALKRLIPH